MAEIRDYSVTADDNNAASPNGMANGCAPSTVNDTWREGIARMKRWYEDCQGAKTTTGSSNAYLLAASRVVASYAAGDAYMFKANHTNTSAGSTLNVDSVGAKAIVTPTGAAIAAGSITSGGVYLVAYEASVDKFMLIGGSHSGGDNPFIYNSSPTLTLENSTSEDTSGGRESQVVFKGLQSGSEESTLVKITASHEGTSDDQKGQLVIGVNDGNDNDAPTTAITVASTGNTTLAKNLTLASDAAVLGFGVDSDVTISHTADTGLTLSAGNNDTTLQLDSNADDADAAPQIILNRTSDSPADGDFTGIIKFRQENDNNQQFTSANIAAKATDVSDGTEDSELILKSMVNGTLTAGLTLSGSGIQVPDSGKIGSVSAPSTIDINSAGEVGIGAASKTSATLFVYNNETGHQAIDIHQDNSSSTSQVVNILNDGEGYGFYNVNSNGSGTYTQSSRGAAGYYRQTGSVANNYAIYAQGDASYGIYARTLSTSHGGLIAYDDAAACYGILGYSPSTTLYSLYGNGSTYITGSYTGSDSRLKDIQSRITTSDGILAKVNQLKPTYYKWKANSDQGKADDAEQIGFIAQEVESIFNHVVKDAPVPDLSESPPDADGKVEKRDKTLNEELGNTKFITYEKLTVYLTAALQEASAKIDALEARIEALES